jgi:hypothetical protein
MKTAAETIEQLMKLVDKQKKEIEEWKESNEVWGMIYYNTPQGRQAAHISQEEYRAELMAKYDYRLSFEEAERMEALIKREVD